MNVDSVLPTGMYAALVSPVKHDGRLDHDGLERLLGAIVESGVRGISTAGSTGEGPRMSSEQRLEIYAAVRCLVPPSVVVVPTVAVTDVNTAAAELDALAAQGAAAALVAPPYYYPATGPELDDFYRRLADRAKLPIIVYNIPARTGVEVPAEVVGRLAHHDYIVGIKDSSRNMEYLQSILYATAGCEFRTFTGSDTLLLASFLLGADGAIAASVNLVPRLGTAVLAAASSGDIDRARRLQRLLFDVVLACRRGLAPAGWKAALKMVGVCPATMVNPAIELSEPLYADLRADLMPLLAEVERAVGGL